jgi:hypothetical protein
LLSIIVDEEDGTEFISANELAETEFSVDDLAYLFCGGLGHLIPPRFCERCTAACCPSAGVSASKEWNYITPENGLGASCCGVSGWVGAGCKRAEVFPYSTPSCNTLCNIQVLAA